jgi:hypothetical protein
MKLLRFEVSNTPHLTITCHSDLEVNGGREGEVAIKVYGDPNDLDVQREGESFTLTLRTRCKVACPQAATLTIPQASGNLRVRRVDGPLAIEQVHGDTVLRDVGPTTIVQASGSVSARSVQGDLGLNDVLGDVSLRGVEGKLLGDIKGNLKASYLESGLEAKVNGNCSLKTDFTPGCDYLLTTLGNASFNFPAQASAHINVTTHGNLKHKVDWAEIEQISEGTLSGRVGQGEARVEIEASGNVSLRGRSETGTFVFGWAVDDEFDEGLGIELESMAEELERNIEMHMARLEAKLKDIDQEAIRRKATRAAETARRKALRAAERARIKAERAERRWERMSPRHSGSSRHATRGRGPSPPPPPPPPVTSDERMMILRMVQEGKITADEGARLLEAMEG